MKVYEVMTDLAPEMLTELAAETYRAWLLFALGKEEIGGRTLANPSGRYAASISWKRTGESSIAIIADERMAPEAGWVETGRKAFSMKAKMLRSPGTKRSKAGYRYRVIPISNTKLTPSLDLSRIVSSPNGESVPAKASRMWTRAWRASRHTGSANFTTMTDKPGTSAWVVPSMPAYSPAAILAELMRRVTE